MSEGALSELSPTMISIGEILQGWSLQHGLSSCGYACFRVVCLLLGSVV